MRGGIPPHQQAPCRGVPDEEKTSRWKLRNLYYLMDWLVHQCSVMMRINGRDEKMLRSISTSRRDAWILRAQIKWRRSWAVKGRFFIWLQEERKCLIRADIELVEHSWFKIAGVKPDILQWTQVHLFCSSKHVSPFSNSKHRTSRSFRP